MELYDIKGKALHFDIDNDKTDIKRTGVYGMVHKIDNDTCLKKFAVMGNRNIADIDTFNELMSFNLPNFYQVYQLLYGNALEKDGKRKIAGYLMKYYSETVNNILDMPMDYLLSNFEDLAKVMKILSQKYIHVNDLHDDNIILTDNGMVIIDADNCFRHGYSYDDTFAYNKKYLYYCLRDIMLKAFCDNYDYSGEMRVDMSQSIIDLFDPHNSRTSIKNKLRSYKKPIDYVISSVK